MRSYVLYVLSFGSSVDTTSCRIRTRKRLKLPLMSDLQSQSSPFRGCARPVHHLLPKRHRTMVLRTKDAVDRYPTVSSNNPNAGNITLPLSVRVLRIVPKSFRSVGMICSLLVFVYTFTMLLGIVPPQRL